jgi:hypothetical protein
MALKPSASSLMTLGRHQCSLGWVKTALCAKIMINLKMCVEMETWMSV